MPESRAAKHFEGRLATWVWLGHVLFAGRRQHLRQYVRDQDVEAVDEVVDHRSTPINILCMDGGGIRGRCLLTMVEEMERTLGSPISAYFDLVAGTSIGGCGALFLARYPDGDATQVARAALSELRTRCFADRSARRLLTLGHLCADERKEFMHDLCGSPSPQLHTLRRGPKAFAVAARRRGRGLEPFLFRTYRVPAAPKPADDAAATSSAPLVGSCSATLEEAVEATSAAPVVRVRLSPRARRRQRPKP